MTLEAQSRELLAGTLLVAPGTLVPPAWVLRDGAVAGGWQWLINSIGGREFAGAGWTVFFMAGTISATARGSSGPKRLDAALARLIRIATRQRCNCLEIDDVGFRSFLGIPYTRISGHSRHIQEGLVFSGQ